MTQVDQEAYMQRTGVWPDFPMGSPVGNMDAWKASQPGQRFARARERYAEMSQDEHAARKFGRNVRGFTPNGI